MPGLAPFLESLSLPAYFCANCGFWQRHFGRPLMCPLCLDARHVVPKDGWQFLSLAEAQRAYPCHRQQLEEGVWKIFNDPVEGIGSSGYLVLTPTGNFCFEAAAVYDDETLDWIASLGGIAVLSASHPHSYGALWQLQDRFEPELALHPGDFQWSAAVRVTWPFDDAIEVLPGISLHHTGGHFAGHTAAYIAAHQILMCGDALKFELDPNDPRRATTISTHKAFVRGVPCTPAELRKYREVFAALDFKQTWTPFEQVANSGRTEALALFRHLLSTRPHPHPVPLEPLRVSASH